MTDMIITRRCSLFDCDRKHSTRGFCKMHYQRWRKGLDLTTPPKHQYRDVNDPAFKAFFWTLLDIKANPDECWEWTRGKNQDGYGRIMLSGVFHFAHRLAWKYTHGKDTDLHILHHCDNRICSNPNHLYAGTNADNIRDRVERGRSNPPLGENHKKSIAKLDQIKEVKCLYRDGMTQVAIAKQVGLSKGIVNYAVTGRTWRHVII